METNWSGSLTYSAARLHRPETVEQVQELVSHCSHLKALGARHSFSGVADTTGDLLSLEHLDQVAIDPERHTVTLGAGVRYAHLCKRLSNDGYALHNLASLPHVTVAGACATGTHGSGDRNGNLSTAVIAMEMVTADGRVTTFSRDEHGEQFQRMVIHLGGLGIVTKLVLEIHPAFEMRQDVYENLPLVELEAHFDTLTSSAYSVSLFTDWRTEKVNQVWVKRRITDGTALKLEPELFGATLAAGPLHPIAGMDVANCTEQMGIPGPWHERLTHFRADYLASSGEELQTEYFVPRRHAFDALRAIDGLREQVAPLLQVSEIRTIAADTLWMSPCYRRDCIAIHFTWKKDWPAVRELLPAIEARLEPFDARPHWGKLFTMAPARLQSLYERLPEFRDLLRRYDPEGKFRNAFLDAYIFWTG